MNKALLICTVLALLVPATAGAKEISGLKVCGASGCAPVDPAVLEKIGEGSNGETLARFPALQPYYKLVYTVTAAPGEQFGGGKKEMEFAGWYLPRAKVTQGVNEGGYIVWSPASAEYVAAIEQVAANITPFAAPTIARVEIGSRVVTKRAQSYARLLTAGKTVPLVDASDWQSVRLVTREVSPWTNGIAMDLSAKKHAVFRGGRYAKLNSRMTSAAAAGIAVPPAGSGGGSFPWSWLVVGLVGALLAAALGTYIGRPRRVGRPIRPEVA